MTFGPLDPSGRQLLHMWGTGSPPTGLVEDEHGEGSESALLLADLVAEIGGYEHNDGIILR